MKNNRTFLEKLLNGAEVEWKTLGEVAKIQRGASPRPISQYITDDPNGIPWIKIGDTTTDSKYIERTAQKITPEGAEKSRVLKCGDFVMSNSMSYGRPYILKISGAIHDGWASISDFESILTPNFLYYYLSSNPVQDYWDGKINSSSVSNLNSDIIKSLPIPIPPLSVQTKIVKILDALTALTSELTSELILRQKQYEYYREKLLSEEELGKVGFEWKCLKDICDYVDFRGKTPKKTESGIFLVTAKNIKKGFIDYNSSKEFVSESDYIEIMRRGLPQVGDVLITTEAPCGNVAQIDKEDIALAQRVIKYRSSNANILDNTFLKFMLLSKDFQTSLIKLSTGGTVKGIKGSTLHKMKIKIPPIDEQKHIISILEKFETLTNSISEGLPLAIEQSQKRYEYYRELLLNF